jgi:ketosteroid isomerase-like protein
MAASTEVAWSYFAHLNEGRIDDAISVLDPDGTWWTCGSRLERPMADHIVLFPKVLAVVPMRYELLAAHDAADVAVLEMASSAELPGDRHFANVYAFVITVQRGRLRSVREYSDTAHLLEVAPDIKAMYAAPSD